MTAIAGLWRLDDRPDAAEAVARMLAAQSAFGPHHGAHWAEESIALGRRLYRLLPEDVHDHGPVCSAGGGLVGVADIRLDNREELLRALEIGREAGAVMSDAAVLLAAFARWSEGALDRLCGEFACAVWDRRRRRLMLARDCRGYRPLHYHRGADFFAFDSMPQGLHALPEVQRAPDCDYAAEAMAMMCPYGERTFFTGIASVAAGHVVTVATGAVTERRYWNPPRPAGRPKTRDYYIEGVRHHLEQAVRASLRGTDGRVASQLSAGLDSSTVTATAARLLAPSGGTVTAFTAVPRPGYAESPLPGLLMDEGPLAAATAALYPNIEHVRVPGDGRSLFAMLDRDLSLFGRPMFGLYNLAWVAAILQAARDRGLRVMLVGDTGNATISHDGCELLPSLLLAGRWSRLVREIRALVRTGVARPRGVLVATVGPFLPAALRDSIARLRRRAPDLRNYAPIAEPRFRRLNLVRRARHGLPRDGFASRLWLLDRADPGLYRKGFLGGWGIDQRDPTGDRRVIEFCLAIPPDQCLVNGVVRSLARDAFADRLPAAVVAETRRGWQAADWHKGLTAGREQAAAEIALMAECPAVAATLDLPRLHELVANWPTGGWEEWRISTAYREGLTRAIATGHFLRRAAGGD